VHSRELYIKDVRHCEPPPHRIFRRSSFQIRGSFDTLKCPRQRGEQEKYLTERSYGRVIRNGSHPLLGLICGRFAHLAKFPLKIIVYFARIALNIERSNVIYRKTWDFRSPRLCKGIEYCSKPREFFTASQHALINDGINRRHGKEIINRKLENNIDSESIKRGIPKGETFIRICDFT